MSAGAMLLCRGCGFHVEREDAFGYDIARADAFDAMVKGGSGASQESCDECVRCRAAPGMRESYRRGFNAGIEAMRIAASQAVSKAEAELRRDRKL